MLSHTGAPESPGAADSSQLTAYSFGFIHEITYSSPPFKSEFTEGQRDFAIFLHCQLSAVGGGKNREVRINADFRAPLVSCAEVVRSGIEY